jgi:hypothetical protein
VISGWRGVNAPWPGICLRDTGLELPDCPSGGGAGFAREAPAARPVPGCLQDRLTGRCLPSGRAVRSCPRASGPARRRPPAEPAHLEADRFPEAAHLALAALAKDHTEGAGARGVGAARAWGPAAAADRTSWSPLPPACNKGVAHPGCRRPPHSRARRGSTPRTCGASRAPPPRAASAI